MKTIVAILFFILSCVTAIYARSSDDGEAILAEIKSHGAKEVLNRLYADGDGAWPYVLQKISTGGEQWLKVAVALHPVSDAGAAEQLTGAVGDALDAAPDKVLFIASSTFGLGDICGTPSIDNHDYSNNRLIVSALDKRIQKVSQVSGENVVSEKAACLSILKDTRANFSVDRPQP